MYYQAWKYHRTFLEIAFDQWIKLKKFLKSLWNLTILIKSFWIPLEYNTTNHKSLRTFNFCFKNQEVLLITHKCTCQLSIRTLFIPDWPAMFWSVQNNFTMLIRQILFRKVLFDSTFVCYEFVTQNHNSTYYLPNVCMRPLTLLWRKNMLFTYALGFSYWVNKK